MTYGAPWDPPSNPFWTSPVDTAKADQFSPDNSIQGRNTKANLATAPDLTSLTNLINGLNQTAQTSANAGRIPNNPALEQKSSSNIASMLGGQLPTDVTNQLSQAAAERGIATGSPGSPNSNASLLRSLGLNSLQLQQQGQQNLSLADARNPIAPLFDPTSQLLTPGQSGSLGLGQSQLALEWFRALNPNYGRQMGGGGGQQRGAAQSPNMDWFSRALSTANGGLGVAPRIASPVGSGVGGGDYPAGTVNTPDSSYYDPFGSLFPTGSTNTGYNPSPLGTYTGSSSSSYDPFYGLDSSIYNAPPADTTTTDTSSTYDPFGGYY